MIALASDPPDGPMQFVAVCAACGQPVVESDRWFEQLEPLARHLDVCQAGHRRPASTAETLERFAIVARRRPA